MHKLRNNARILKCFDHVYYETVFSSQQSNRPLESVAQGEKFFLGKHEVSGYKVGLSVLLIGICIGCTKHYPWSVSHSEVALNNPNFTKKYWKVVIGLELLDERLAQEMLADQWAILAGKKYQGATDSFRVVQPKKYYQNFSLSGVDQNNDRRISLDRNAVENFSGQLHSLLAFFHTYCRWNEIFSRFL